MAAEVAEFFAEPAQNMEVYQIVDADHGRIETRAHRVSQKVDWLFSDRRYKGATRFAGLATIACVTSTRQIGEVTTTATRLSFASAHLTPARFAAAVRAHWAIENSLHWVLVVTFDEDRARNRKDKGPENLKTLGKLTPNLLRKARPKLPVSRKRKRAGWSDAVARSSIGQMRWPCRMVARHWTWPPVAP